MRFDYLHIKGTIGAGAIRVDGIVVKDNDTDFLFFITKDHRLHDAGWVFGGLPISMCDNENWWNDVCRYCVGTGYAITDFNNALHRTGCGQLAQFEVWEPDTDFPNGVQSTGPLTPTQMDELLDYTIHMDRVGEIPLQPNTDYECATQVFPWRSGSERIGAAAPRATSGPSAEALPDIMCDEYENGIIYEGYSGYHAHHGKPYNKAKNGYGKEGYMIGVELEVECKNRDCKKKLNATRSNWFYQERDGSLSDYGTEIITVPLRPVDAHSEDFWKKLCEPVSKVATSWDKESTGLHVHISRTILGNTPDIASETLGKLLFFYHQMVLDGGPAEAINKDIYGRARTYHACDGKTEEGRAAKTLGGSILKHKDVKDRVKNCMIRKSTGERYFDINLQNANTIEFRKGKGSIKADRIAMVVAWSELMCLYCRKTKWEDLSFEAFRCFVRDSKFAPQCLKDRV